MHLLAIAPVRFCDAEVLSTFGMFPRRRSQISPTAQIPVSSLIFPRPSGIPPPFPGSWKFPKSDTPIPMSSNLCHSDIKNYQNTLSAFRECGPGSD